METFISLLLKFFTEAVAGKCSAKKMFLEISILKSLFDEVAGLQFATLFKKAGIFLNIFEKFLRTRFIFVKHVRASASVLY